MSPDKNYHPSGRNGGVKKDYYNESEKDMELDREQQRETQDLRNIIERRMKNGNNENLKAYETKSMINKNRLNKVSFSKRKVHALQRARGKRKRDLRDMLLKRIERPKDFVENEMPVDPLIVFGGVLNEIPVSILKDDGCNTNVVSRSFYEKHKEKFPSTEETDLIIQHSSQKATEKGKVILKDVCVSVGPHTYRSNFVVADCRYDVLLGMPWHVENEPTVNYKEKTVKLSDCLLAATEEPDIAVKVQSISVKKFRRLYRKKKGALFCLKINSLVQGNRLLDGRQHISDPELARLVDEYKEVFRSELPAGLPPKREVEHEIIIDPDAKIPFRKLYHLSPKEQEATRVYITSLLKQGVIRPSRSPFGAPLFFAKQPGRPLRGVVDYRALNAITKRNNAPLPRTDEMFDRFGGAKYFTKMDLKTGFHQIRVREIDIEKTAFNLKYGQFEYLVMPMGMANAPATFQTLMNNILREFIDVFCMVYMDDIIIFSRSLAEHREHVAAVLRKLKEHKLYVSPGKCEFMKEEIEFLGFIVTRKGLKVNPAKVKVIKEWPRPSTLRDLRAFLGLVQYFRRFIKGFSRIAAPLTNLTKKNVGLRSWDDECSKSFKFLKDSLTNAPLLRSPDWSKPFRGHIDASQEAVGGTLTQPFPDGEHPIAYSSQKLSPAERNYSASDRELLGLVSFLKRFRCYLEGSEFEIFTDNQVLKHFFTKEKLSRREASWLSLFGRFGIFPITLKKGSIHVLGDTSSRAPHAEAFPPVLHISNVTSFHVAASELQIISYLLPKDAFFGPIFLALQGTWPSDNIRKTQLSKTLSKYHLDEKGLLWYESQLCVPRKYVRKLLELAHDAKCGGHFGFAKTLGRLKPFCWKKKSKDVKLYVKGCDVCQRNKTSTQAPLSNPQILQTPSRRWGSVSTDFIVQLPRTKSGYDAITTWVDRLSRRVHFIPGKTNDTAVDVAKSFFNVVYRHHGLPDEIISDRDRKFISKFWEELMNLAGVKLSMSSSHHPQTNGSSEIMNKMIENYLRCFVNFRQDDWDEYLISAEVAYNSAVIEELGHSPYFLDLGWEPKQPLDLFTSRSSNVSSVQDLRVVLLETLEDAKHAYEVAHSRQAAYNAARTRSIQYSVGDLVLLKKSLFEDYYSRRRPSQKLSAKKFGPFKVTGLVGRNAIHIKIPHHYRIHPVVHIIHTEPYHQKPVHLRAHDAPPPVYMPSNEAPTQEEEVETILAHRRRGRGYQYLVKWKHLPDHETSWEPRAHLQDEDGTINVELLKYLDQHDLK